jgi:hypothetical protein
VQERTLWLETYLPEIEAKAEADLPDSATNREIDKLVVSAVVLRWRYYLRRTPRDFSPARRQSTAEAEIEREIAGRLAALTERPSPQLPSWVTVHRH